jgi:N-acetylglutamate synthase-like GNAT family acetyltransferase
MLTTSNAGSLKGLSLVRILNESTGLPIAASGNANSWLFQAADMLCTQWPLGGDSKSYREKIVYEFGSGVNELYGLPCSYLLVDECDKCIGHGRLTECFESAGGNAAAASFIVISSPVRGQGLGSHLMSLLDCEAKRLGYHYLYLWTKTAIGFYKKIGYKECQRVSLKRSCLKMLASEEVQSLEALLMRRQNITLKTSMQKIRPKETILLPPDEDDDENIEDVWLRKRLVEHVGSIYVKKEKHREEIESAIAFHSKRNELDWCYCLLSLPWQSQIGPSCGLAALRMAREYFWTNARQDVEQPLPSLLGEAQERGYTIDGELFDANDLKELASSVCGIDCVMWSVAELQPTQVYQILSERGIFIIPYDSNPRTRLPTKLSGQSAHYGIIVGMVIGVEKDGQQGNFRPLIDGDFKNDHDSDCIFLLVQHSLSSNLSIASWNDYVESNGQLVTMDKTKFENAHLDLCDHIILCKGLFSDCYT